MSTNRPIGVVVKGIAIGTGGLGFDSRTDQIGHSVAVAETCLGNRVVHALSCRD